MKYRVDETFKLHEGTPDEFELRAGSTFIPAETNVGVDVVAALVSDGKISLIRASKEAPATQAKRK